MKTLAPGTKGKCSKCKTVIEVPASAPQSLGKTLDAAPDQTIDGSEFSEESSLSAAGLNGSIDLESTLHRQKTIADPSAPSSGSLESKLSYSNNSNSKYIIDKEIARGGMGAIIRAVDTDINREVAIKVILDSNDKSKQRFVEEAQVTGQLEHPNIVPVHELGLNAEGKLYFSMKMVRGDSLGDVLDELRKNSRSSDKKYTLGKLLNIFVKVCEAMAFAHSKGVVHRDLKPDNIMVGEFGEVLVMDWGLAKVAASRTARESTRVRGKKGKKGKNGKKDSDSRLGKLVESFRHQSGSDMTLDGSVSGTPLYMAPEQAEGRISDIDEECIINFV